MYGNPVFIGHGGGKFTPVKIFFTPVSIYILPPFISIMIKNGETAAAETIN